MRWKDVVPIDKSSDRTAWLVERKLMGQCKTLGPEYKYQVAETFPGVDPVNVFRRNLGDGYDIEVAIHGNYRRWHYRVSLWANYGRECIKSVGDLFYRQIPEYVDELINNYVPNGNQRQNADEIAPTA